MITLIGEISLTDVCPLIAKFQAYFATAKAFAVPELQAKLAGLGNVLAAISVRPPSLDATIAAAVATVASLRAAIAGPVVTLQVAAITSLIASLNVQLGALLLTVSVPDVVVSAYVYDGASANIGAELQAAISATLPGVHAGDHANALILATTSRPAWIGVGGMFKVSLP